MFQLPLLTAGSAAPGARLPGMQGDAKSGLGGLLAGQDALAAGFSAEMQAMLMQLSPAMLARLDEMLAGGMNLPQAATALLDEFASAGGMESFAELLRQHPGRTQLPADAAQAADNLRAAAVALTTVAPPTGIEKGSADSTLLDPVPALNALHAIANGPVGGQGAVNQLTANLLDMRVPQQVGGRGWDGAIADRVMWMAQGDQQFARLKLSPPNLGPLEVRVTINQDQASVSFIAQHAAVREALEAAMPRLREMFDQSSLQLVRADVSDPGTGQGERSHDSSAQGSHAGTVSGAPDDPLDEGAALQHASAIATRLVDLFA